jgi:hypothetical protein
MNVTPQFLVKLRNSYKTDIEAEAALQRYIGKWMQVSGKLENMSYGTDPNKDFLFVFLLKDDIPTEQPKSVEDPAEQPGSIENTAKLLDNLAKHLESVRIVLVFPDQKWIDEMTTFSHADKVIAIGELEGYSREASIR